MQNLYASLALFLLLNLGAGMWRVLRGPTPADRMLAAQLFGTTAVAILLLLAEVTGSAARRGAGLLPAGSGNGGGARASYLDGAGG